MATVAFTRYHADDRGAVGRTNDYLVDGHGVAIERTNRYIVSPGKHGETPSAGYNCPADPTAATELMETLRARYELWNEHRKILSGESKRRDITHVMFYVSWADLENVSAEEAMEMTRELIERTALKDFANFYAYHNNTDNKHTHISTCPYSLDGSRKLSITDRLKHDIWREADRICVEHGYSIIRTPVLLADPDYREWFEGVARSGKVIIHKHKKYRRKYEDKLRYREAKERERAARKPKRKTYELLQRLDITTVDELEQHIKCVGHDIEELKKDIAHQTRILDRMAPLLAIIETWESKYTSSAKAALERFKIESEEDIEDVKKRAARAQSRREKNEQLLSERNSEYAQLKKAANIMTPKMWQEFAAPDSDEYDYESDKERIRRASAQIEKWLAEAEEARRIAAAEEEKKEWYIQPRFIDSQTKRPYRVYRYYSTSGRPMSDLEVMFVLAVVVLKKESSMWVPSKVPPDKEHDICYAKPDTKVQLMLDSMRFSQEENVYSLYEIEEKRRVVGSTYEQAKNKLNQCQSEHDRMESIKNAAIIYDRTCRSDDPEEKEKCDVARSVLSANGINTTRDLDMFRYNWRQNEAALKTASEEFEKAKKRYRKLKILEKAYYLTDNTTYCYGPYYRAPVEEEPTQGRAPSIDAQIGGATSRRDDQQRTKNPNYKRNEWTL